MRQAFVFDKIVVLVGPWHEPMDPPERGARVEVRLLADESWRGTPSAAQRLVIDQPVFRADLFDQVDGPPGNLRSAHFHPHFEGVEPSVRNWDDEVKRDPVGWLTAELSDLHAVLKRGGVDAGDWADGDAAALRDALPDIVRAVEATWAVVRT